jgi:prenyltransferase beta subunit
MRLSIPLAILVLLPPASFGQNKEIQDQIDQKLATIRFVRNLQDVSGGFRPTADGKAGIRATTAGIRALKYVSGKPVKECVPNLDKATAFVMSCYDPKTGGFADPGGKPDVFTTSVGIMGAIELGVPKEKFAKAMDYLTANAKTFEEVRIAAAAVESWGVNECPFDLNPWIQSGRAQVKLPQPDAKDGGARDLGSVAALGLRLEAPVGNQERAMVARYLLEGQRDDGGWNEKGAKTSDLGSTYRVMRAVYLFKEKPKDVAKLRRFIAKCRNADGGYGVKPGDPSTIGSVYYAAIITHWLDQLQKR